MPASNFESGLRPSRTEWVAETTTGVPPTNPAWNRFSDKVRAFNEVSEVGLFDVLGLGDVDPADFLPGPETHRFPVEYYLQQALSASAANDGLTRNADGQLPNSHTVVHRIDRSTGSVGADAGGIRQYYVGLGCWQGEAVLDLQTSTGEPVVVTQDYAAEKGRVYRIDQPAASGTLTIESTDAADTTQDVTIEDENAGTSETNTLSGTTPVATTASFADIDAIYLSAETDGDVIVKTSGGTTLATIRGKTYYNGAEGDLGVPLLGSGSHASAISASYEQFRAATLERPAATALAFAVANASIRVNNNLEIIPVLGLRQEIQPGARTTELSATVFGTAETHDKIDDHLGAVQTDIVLTLPKSTLTMHSAVVGSPGQVGISRAATIQLGATYRSKGLTVT